MFLRNVETIEGPSDRSRTKARETTEVESEGGVISVTQLSSSCMGSSLFENVCVETESGGIGETVSVDGNEMGVRANAVAEETREETSEESSYASSSA